MIFAYEYEQWLHEGERKKIPVCACYSKTGYVQSQSPIDMEEPLPCPPKHKVPTTHIIKKNMKGSLLTYAHWSNKICYSGKK